MPTTIERLREAQPPHRTDLTDDLLLHGWTPEHETTALAIIRTGTVSPQRIATFRTTLLNEARNLYRTDDPEMVLENTGQYHPVFTEADFINYRNTVDEIIHMPDEALKEVFKTREAERLKQWDT